MDANQYYVVSFIITVVALLVVYSFSVLKDEKDTIENFSLGIYFEESNLNSSLNILYYIFGIASGVLFSYSHYYSSHQSLGKIRFYPLIYLILVLLISVYSYLYKSRLLDEILDERSEYRLKRSRFAGFILLFEKYSGVYFIVSGIMASFFAGSITEIDEFNIQNVLICICLLSLATFYFLLTSYSISFIKAIDTLLGLKKYVLECSEELGSKTGYIIRELADFVVIKYPSGEIEYINKSRINSIKRFHQAINTSENFFSKKKNVFSK